MRQLATTAVDPTRATSSPSQNRMVCERGPHRLDGCGATGELPPRLGSDCQELGDETQGLWRDLYDPDTGLPSVPAVLGQLRRWAEKGRPIGTLLVDLSSEHPIEEGYGWSVYDRVLRQVAQILQGLRGSTLGDHDIVAQRRVRSDRFVLFLELVGPNPEAALALVRERVLQELGRKLTVQVGSDRPRSLGVRAAGRVVPRDPTTRIERSVYRALDDLDASCRHEVGEPASPRLAELRRILTSRDILIRYQPIVHLADRAVYGFEALTASGGGQVFENPERLFSFAEQTEQIVELEQLCRLESVRGAAALPAGRKLFLNCSAHGIADLVDLSTDLTAEIETSGLSVADVVLEITERVAVKGWRDFRRRLDHLRTLGFLVAIDDMGAGYSSLRSVAEVEPDFLWGRDSSSRRRRHSASTRLDSMPRDGGALPGGARVGASESASMNRHSRFRADRGRLEAI